MRFFQTSKFPLGTAFHICSLGFLVICLVKTTPEAEEIVILGEVVQREGS